MQLASITVSELNEYVGSLISRDPVLRNLRVKGEISGFKRHTSGHLYFSLKDQSGLVRCVMFRQAAQQLSFRPQDGMQVVLIGYAALYTRDGQFQLYAQSLEQEGEGDLYKQFLLLKTKLEAKGYFDVSRKRPIPQLPRCVGIVTSGTGAALQDILQIIRRRYPTMDIVYCPVAVQGQGAAQEIAAGIRQINWDGRADVMIVGRGGGSMEDLWAFNEIPVATAIFKSQIPVISAVGHETDFTIADFTADLRAPTPSAAAELCVPEYAQLSQQTDALLYRLSRSLQHGVVQKRQRTSMLLQSKGFSNVSHMLCIKRQTLITGQQAMLRACQARLASSQSSLHTYLGRLEALGPKSVLRRGYALVQRKGGQPVDHANGLSPQEQIILRMQDGQVFAQVEDVNLHNEANNSAIKE